MSNVDPFVVQWPRKWTDDPEIGPVIDYLNRFLHDIFIRTGGGDDIIATAIQTPVEAQASIEEIRQRLGSGQFLTSDCDSFTVDSTTLYVEMTEA